MKRVNNIYEKIISIENLNLADEIARKGKSKQYGIIQHDKNRDENILKLHETLKANAYKTSEYDIFKVFEPKEREVYRLPYFPDRIMHHAIMNYLELIFTNMFTKDSYSCIKGKGIHACLKNVKKALADVPGTKYCLKLDIKKFYPSVTHGTLIKLLKRKFKDRNLMALLEEIISSAPGLPIGNYLSQYFANFYLTYFDHWIKEEKRVRYYFRYADDIVILSDSKEHLHQILADITAYLQKELQLTVKSNYQIFPVESRSIDFLGYRFYHTHIQLRKSIKQNFARMLASKPNPQSIASYYGWISHCNGNHLLKKLLNDQQFQRLKNKSSNRKLRRRQNKNLENPEQTNPGH